MFSRQHQRRPTTSHNQLPTTLQSQNLRQLKVNQSEPRQDQYHRLRRQNHHQRAQLRNTLRITFSRQTKPSQRLQTIHLKDHTTTTQMRRPNTQQHHGHQPRQTTHIRQRQQQQQCTINQRQIQPRLMSSQPNINTTYKPHTTHIQSSQPPIPIRNHHKTH